jgi:hypothetical protein
MKQLKIFGSSSHSLRGITSSIGLGRGLPFAPPPSVGGRPRSHSLRGESLTVSQAEASCTAGRLHDAAEFAAKGAAGAALTYAGSSHTSPESERAPQARA